MLTFGILLAVGIALFAFLMLSPLVLRLDTRAGHYVLQWRGLGSARLIGTPQDPVVRIWLLGWRKHIHLLEPRERAAKAGSSDKHGKKKDKKRNRRPRWMNRRLGLRLLRTFRVRTLRLTLDTGDFVRNAYWYPLFRALSRGRRQLIINFRGENELQLHVSNRLGKVAWVVLRGILSPTKR